MELIGLEHQIRILRNWVKNYNKELRKCMILYGPPGVGKTSSVYCVAEELGYEVIEFNASEERTVDFFSLKLRPLVRTLGFTPQLVLLDELEDVPKKAQMELAKIIPRSKKPIVVTTNDISSISPKVKLQSAKIEYNYPSIQTIIQYASKKGIKDVSRLKDVKDMRQLKMIAEFGSDGYKCQPDDKRRILRMMSSGDYSDISATRYQNDLPILLDNSVHLSGVKLWEFIEALRAYDLTKNPISLKGIRVNIVESQFKNFFYTKLFAARRKKRG